MAVTKTITILGVTGSIGDSATAFLTLHPDAFDVYAVTAHKNAEILAQRAIALKAKIAVIGDEAGLLALQQALAGTGIQAQGGEAALLDIAAHKVDITLSAIVGFAALKPTMKAIDAGNHIALANKECLVCAGHLLLEAAKKRGVRILPVDSEHNAIFQVFEAENRQAIRRLILTASGGPFRLKSRDELRHVTREQALKHPNWSMGPKITIDSATMMNKALELIEAHFLFDMPPEKIDALIHPQSIIHSMVEYDDGSILAQMGPPDMRVPIASALSWPARRESGVSSLDFLSLNNGLTFEKACEKRFPALRLAREAMGAGQAAMIALNAGNEVAVEAFLAGGMAFVDIEKTVETVMEKYHSGSISVIEDVFEIDKMARMAAHEALLRKATA